MAENDDVRLEIQSVAHDMRREASAIAGACAVLLEECELDERAGRLVQINRDAARRLWQLSRRLVRCCGVE